MEAKRTSGSNLRCFAQFTFSHDPLIRFADASNAIFELATMLWQFFSDDVCASCNVLAYGGIKKHSLAGLELINRHNALTQKSTATMQSRLFAFEAWLPQANAVTRKARVAFPDTGQPFQTSPPVFAVAAGSSLAKSEPCSAKSAYAPN
jgi:hypothetical protein